MSQNNPNPSFPQFPQPIRPPGANQPPSFTPIQPGIAKPQVSSDNPSNVRPQGAPGGFQPIQQFKPIAPLPTAGSAQPIGGFKPLTTAAPGVTPFKPLNVAQFKPIGAPLATNLGGTTSGTSTLPSLNPVTQPSTTISSPSQPSGIQHFQPQQLQQPQQQPQQQSQQQPQQQPQQPLQTQQRQAPSPGGFAPAAFTPIAPPTTAAGGSITSAMSNLSIQPQQSQPQPQQSQQPQQQQPQQPQQPQQSQRQQPQQQPQQPQQLQPPQQRQFQPLTQPTSLQPQFSSQSRQFQPLASPASSLPSTTLGNATSSGSNSRGGSDIPQSNAGSSVPPAGVPAFTPITPLSSSSASTPAPFAQQPPLSFQPLPPQQQQQQQQQQPQQPQQQQYPLPSPISQASFSTTNSTNYTSIPTPVHTLSASNSFNNVAITPQHPPQQQHQQQQQQPQQPQQLQPQHLPPSMKSLDAHPYPPSVNTPSSFQSSHSSYPPMQQQHPLPPQQYPHPQQPQQQQQQQQKSQHPQHPQQHHQQHDDDQEPHPSALSKIAVHQVPRMQETLTTTVFTTGQCILPPPAGSDYIVIDNGSCSPRFMRSTLNAIAQEREKQNIVALPVGGVVQPLGEPGPGEAYVPVRDVSTTQALGILKQHHDDQLKPKNTTKSRGFFDVFGFGGGGNDSSSSTAASPQYAEDSAFSSLLSNDLHNDPSGTGFPNSNSLSAKSNVPYADANDPEIRKLLGPLRCFHCRAYANPYFKFIQNGTQFVCNFCDTAQGVPPHYYSSLDGEGRRMDSDSKFEFSKGSVEFIVPPWYAQRRQYKTHPIDVSLDDQMLAKITSKGFDPMVYQATAGKDDLSPLTHLAIGAGAAHPHTSSSEDGISSSPAAAGASAGAAGGIASTSSPSVLSRRGGATTRNTTTTGVDNHSYTPTTPHYVFILDVSKRSQELGMLECAIQALINATSELSTHVPYARVSVICFDDCIYIPRYSLQHKDFSFVTMSDIHHPYLPLPSPTCFTPLNDENGYQLFLTMLKQIPEIFPHDHAPVWDQTILIQAAMKVAYFLLYRTGGKVLTLVCPPSRQGRSVYLTDKELDLYQQPDNSSIIMGTECANIGICIDIYMFSNAGDCSWYWIDELIRPTGGQLYFYKHFAQHSDGDALSRDIHRNLLRNTGYSAVMTIRVSQGLQVKDYYGSMFVPSKNEIIMSAIDSDKAIGFSLEYLTPTLTTSKAYIQCAVLFTSVLGDVRIRVHTLCIDVVPDLPAVYRQADISTIVNLQLKQSLLSFHPLQCYYQQQSIAYSFLESLSAYRKHCAKKSPATQLVLPESLKLLPLYIVGMVKNDLYREGLYVDHRAFLISYVRSMPIVTSSSFVIPRLYDLTDSMHLYNIVDPHNAHTCPLVLHEVDSTREPFDPSEDLLGEVLSDHERLQQLHHARSLTRSNPNLIINHEEVRRIHFPTNLSLSSESLQLYKIYLLDDTMDIYIWVGPLVPKQLVSLLFIKTVTTTTISINNNTQPHAVESLILRELNNKEYANELDGSPETNSYYAYGTRLLEKIHRMVQYLRSNKALHQKIHVVQATGKPLTKASKQNSAPVIRTMLEIVFSRKMVEDFTPITTTSSYSTNAKPLSVTLANGVSVNIPSASSIPASTRASCISYLDYLVWAHRLITQRMD